MDASIGYEERVATLKWLMNHKLWIHECLIPIRPGGSILDTLAASRQERESWPLEDVGEGGMMECVDLFPVFVDPSTETIEDDDAKNTALMFWIEAGGWCDMSADEHLLAPKGGWTQDNRWIREHDYDLNCGAPTAEEALLKLAALVRKHYYDDGRKREPCCGET